MKKHIFIFGLASLLTLEAQAQTTPLEWMRKAFSNTAQCQKAKGISGVYPKNIIEGLDPTYAIKLPKDEVSVEVEISELPAQNDPFIFNFETCSFSEAPNPDSQNLKTYLCKNQSDRRHCFDKIQEVDIILDLIQQFAQRSVDESYKDPMMSHAVCATVLLNYFKVTCSL